MGHFDGKGNYTQVDHVVAERHSATGGMDVRQRALHRQSGLYWNTSDQHPRESVFSCETALRGGQTGQGNPHRGRLLGAHSASRTSIGIKVE